MNDELVNNMACEGCEQRRKKLKALYEDSKQSITQRLKQLAARNSKAEQSADSAKQSTDSADSSADSSDTGVATTPRARRRGKTTTPVSG